MNQFLSNFYNGKKVLITGHTGFKGSWLAYWLHMLGAKVYGYALEPAKNSLFNKLNLSEHISSHIGDIRDKENVSNYIQATQPDIVFHLAAQALVRKSYDEPHLTFETNVMGSVNLLESIKHCHSVKSLVYITSDKCYWNSEWVWGYRETDALGGSDPYSASKASAEHVFRSYYLSYFMNRENFGCASTRAGNVIGGGDYSENRIVPDIIKALEHNDNVFLRYPQATRPWQHVLDPLHGYLILGKYLFEHSQSHNGEAWNFGPTSQSIKTVLELTETLMQDWKQQNSTIQFDDPKHHPHESTLLHLSIDKARSLLDWSPIYHFSDAVSKTSNWYKNITDGKDPTKTTTQQILDFMEMATL